MNNRPIGIFDSGVGGLSVLIELKKVLPDENFIFVADQKNVPYGGKTKEELFKLTEKIMTFLLEKNVKTVVIACNTATVYAISFLREKYSVPIIGTVPVIKTLAELTKSKKTAVFSTPATAKSPYLDKLIKKFAAGVVVKKIGGSKLEDLIEEGDLSNPKITKILNEKLEPLKKEGIDAIALGCTHYPFLKDKIEKIVGKGVAVVDSGGAVARRTKQVLINEGIMANEKGNEDQFYTTGDINKFKKALKILLKEETDSVYHLKL